MRRDALRFGELLFDDRLDPCGVGEIDDAAHLGAEHALGDRTRAQIVYPRIGLHQLDAVGLALEPLVDLQERNHAAFPQQRRNRLAARLPVHSDWKNVVAAKLVAGHVSSGGRLTLNKKTNDKKENMHSK